MADVSKQYLLFLDPTAFDFRASYVSIQISTLMGARESTVRNAETGVVDYYKILEVSEDATPDDIKVRTFYWPMHSKTHMSFSVPSGVWR